MRWGAQGNSQTGHIDLIRADGLHYGEGWDVPVADYESYWWMVLHILYALQELQPEKVIEEGGV